MSWIPLNVHSQFSILDSTASVSALAAKTKEYGIAALALTDQGNLHGLPGNQALPLARDLNRVFTSVGRDRP